MLYIPGYNSPLLGRRRTVDGRTGDHCWPPHCALAPLQGDITAPGPAARATRWDWQPDAAALPVAMGAIPCCCSAGNCLSCNAACKFPAAIMILVC